MNRDGMLSDMEFEKRIDELGENQLALIKFVARQQFSSSKLLMRHDERLVDIENGDKKQAGIMGAISGVITSVVIGVITYFTAKRT